jgi:integrase
LPTNRLLTDRTLKSLQRNPPEKEGLLVPDGDVRSLYARPMPSGQISFVMVRRFPRNPQNAARVSLGSYGELTLEQVRDKARRWLALIKQGIDPRDEETARALTEAQKRANTFASFAKDFSRDKLPGERKAREVERDIRRELLPVWANRPITELTALDGRNLIKTVAARAPAQARNILVLMKRMLTWGIDQQIYGLELNPFDKLKAGKIIGEKVVNHRVLSDLELFALHRAATRTPYPAGPIYLLLLLSALRLNEVADASWPEFDLPNKLWTIPASRMKGRNERARPHVVPLIDDIFRIVNEVPKHQRGPYVFSVTSGVSPVWMSDKIKQRINKKMLRTLRALARRRGDDPSKVVLAHWSNHDIRRSCRTQLSKLRIPEEAREAVLAHVRPGIKAVYDHYDYLDAKREALQAWSKRLREITEPPPPRAQNVIKLQTKA